MGAFECVRKVYQTDGLRGFYRGMSASYAGISETVIHFVIYESIKQKLLDYKAPSTVENDEESVKEASDFVGMMLAAATSKTCATTIAYPHGKRSWVYMSNNLLIQEYFPHLLEHLEILLNSSLTKYSYLGVPHNGIQSV